MNEDRRDARRSWIVATVFLILALVAFGPALDAPFDFDDDPAIVENASIRTLWPPTSLWPGPPPGTPVSGRPVVNYSFAVNAAINRALGVEDARRQTIAFHTTNLLLHGAVALLLVGIVYRTARDRAFAVVVGALWLILPIQTEAVNYVTQRSEILVSLWYLATLYASIRAWDASHRTRWLVAAVVFSALGMLSKEVMVTAPLIVLLYDRAFRADSWRAAWTDERRRALYLSLLATTLIGFVSSLSRARGHSVGFDGPITPWEYLWSQAWAIPHYVRLAFWPSGLAFDYGVKAIATNTNIVGFIGLTVAFVLTVHAYTKPSRRWLGFLGAWFFLLLAPSSSLVPIQTEIAAERRIYLALAAVIVLVVVAVRITIKRVLRPALRDGQQDDRSVKAALTVVVIAALAVSSLRSVQYRDLVVRWRDAVAATPTNGRAYDNLASALLRLDPPDIRGADSVLHRATVIDPGFAPAWFRKGTIALAEQRWVDAESLFARTLVLDPHHPGAADRLGRLLVMQKRPDRSVTHLRDVVRRAANIEALTQLGLAYVMLRQFDSATRQLQAAMRLDSTRADVQRYLAVALVEQGRGSEAIAPLETLVRREPTSGISLSLLSLAYAQSHRDSAAARMADSAVANAGDNAAAYLYAGRAALAVGELADASEFLRQSVRLDPNVLEALISLANVEQQLGNRQMAVQLFTRALAIAPNDSAAREGLKR